MTIQLSYSDVEAATARLARHGGVVRTPILTNEALDREIGAQVFVKAECLQQTGSFKIRGALNRLLSLTSEERTRGVVAFSSGNHAQGVARAAKWLGVNATIVMPSDAPAVKSDGVRADGGDIRFYDRNKESREAIAEKIAQETGATLVPSFDDPYIIAGQGSAGMEFFSAQNEAGAPLDHLICCTGGGGLISGIALAGEGLSPETKIWTAEPEDYDDWKRSLETGDVMSNDAPSPSICDAILTPRPGDLTWSIGSRLFAGGFAVSDKDIRAAMRFTFRHLKLVVEPGGAAALAAALFKTPPDFKGARIGVVATGGNVDPAVYAKILSTEA